MTCPNCTQPYDTKPINEEHHPKYVCKNNHLCCKSCCSLLNNCPICKEKKDEVTDEVTVKIEAEEEVENQITVDEDESKRKEPNAVLNKGTEGEVITTVEATYCDHFGTKLN
jgi:hypothetical protein